MTGFYNNSNEQQSNPVGPEIYPNTLFQFAKLDIKKVQSGTPAESPEINHDFVFLGYNQYRFLIERTSEYSMYVSGSTINLGLTKAIKDTSPTVGTENYFTLKFESLPSQDESKAGPNVDLHHPHIVMGMPCPPIWSPELNSGLSDGKLKNFLKSSDLLYKKINEYSKRRQVV